MAGSGVPTPKQAAEDCISRLMKARVPCNMKAQQDAKAACGSQTGAARDRCVSANHRKFVLKYCWDHQLDTCAKMHSKSICESSAGAGCDLTSAIKSWMKGVDPNEARGSVSPDVRAVVEAESDLPIPGFTFDLAVEEPTAKAEPFYKKKAWGVPMWAWIGGGAVVALVIVRK